MLYSVPRLRHVARMFLTRGHTRSWPMGTSSWYKRLLAIKVSLCVCAGTYVENRHSVEDMSAWAS